MNFRIWLLNLLFAGLALAVGLKAFDVWRSPSQLEFPAVKADTPQKSKARAVPRRRTPPARQYDVVVEKNLFSASRIEAIAEAPATAAPPQETRVDDKKVKHFVVYGIILADDYKAALVSRPPTQKGSKADIWVREGDTLDNMRVETIYRDEVVFSIDGVNHSISVYDRAEVKRRSLVAKTEGPTVISTTAKKSTPARVTKKKPRRPTPTKKKPQARTVTKKQRSNTREKAQTGTSSGRARPTTGRSTGTPEQTSENLFQQLLKPRN